MHKVWRVGKIQNKFCPKKDHNDNNMSITKTQHFFSKQDLRIKLAWQLRWQWQQWIWFDLETNRKRLILRVWQCQGSNSQMYWGTMNGQHSCKPRTTSTNEMSPHLTWKAILWFDWLLLQWASFHSRWRWESTCWGYR